MRVSVGGSVGVSVKEYESEWGASDRTWERVRLRLCASVGVGVSECESDRE